MKARNSGKLLQSRDQSAKDICSCRTGEFQSTKVLAENLSLPRRSFVNKPDNIVSIFYNLHV